VDKCKSEDNTRNKYNTERNKTAVQLYEVNKKNNKFEITHPRKTSGSKIVTKSPSDNSLFNSRRIENCNPNVSISNARSQVTFEKVGIQPLYQKPNSFFTLKGNRIDKVSHPQRSDEGKHNKFNRNQTMSFAQNNNILQNGFAKPMYSDARNEDLDPKTVKHVNSKFRENDFRVSLEDDNQYRECQRLQFSFMLQIQVLKTRISIIERSNMLIVKILVERILLL
jgi:hypothetical protein